MFTGIIDHCAMISDIAERNNQLMLTLSTQFSELQAGESIAVDGICLTVNEIAGQQFTCDISPETLRLTTAQFFTVGQQVNLERALRASDRFGGHFVMGHVDCYGQVQYCQQQGDFIQLVFADLADQARVYLVKKGCVTVNGVSLTINAVTAEGFSVMLIPHTLARTNLVHLKAKDKVNIEYDYLARVILHANELNCFF